MAIAEPRYASPVGPRPSFFNDAPWRIPVEPVHADWDSPHGRSAL